jgi:hypothetical protein
MSAIILLGVLLGLGFSVVRALALVRQRDIASDRDALLAAGAENVRVVSRRTVEATFDGRALHYGMVYGRDGSDVDVEAWTPAPGGSSALEMHVRPRASSDAALAEAGHAGGGIAPEPAFAAMFVVKAAPAEAANVALDARARSSLRELAPCTLDVVRGRVVFQKSDWKADQVDPVSVARLVVHVATLLIGVGPELERRKLMGLRDEGGYRGAAPETAAARLADGDGDVDGEAETEAERSYGDRSSRS